MRPFTPIPLLFPLLGAAAPSASGQGSEEVNYDVLAPELVAVELASADAEPDLAEVLARHGLALRSQQPFGARTHRLLELDAPVTDPGARASLLADLRTVPAVEYSTAVYRDELGHPEFPSRSMIVRFEPEVPADLQRAALEAHPWLLAPDQPWEAMSDTWMAATDAVSGAEMLAHTEALSALPGVRWAQPDRVAGATLHDFFPDDTLWNQNWGLHNTGQTTGPLPPSNNSWTGTADVDMDLPEAWDITFGSANIRVVVFDGGIDLNHPDLPVALGADFTGQNLGGGPVNLGACHGTSVGGCITASIDNNLGTTGVAPGCSLLSATVMIPQNFLTCTNSVSIQSSWLIGGLNWAILNGARVTCSSFGMGYDSGVASAYSGSKVAGILHFASSGNNAPNSIGFPANDDDVVAVGNIRPDGVINGSSQTGTVLDLVAPGTNIMTTDIVGQFGYVNGGDYAMVNGTSFAAPYAAGVGALVLSLYPTLDPDEVTWILKLSADDYGTACEDSTFGAGLVNAFRALQLATDFAKGTVQVKSGGGISTFYPTVADGVNAAGAEQLVLIHEGSYAETLTITKPLILRRWTLLEGGCGPAIVGQ